MPAWSMARSIASWVASAIALILFSLPINGSKYKGESPQILRKFIIQRMPKRFRLIAHHARLVPLRSVTVDATEFASGGVESVLCVLDLFEGGSDSNEVGI